MTMRSALLLILFWVINVVAALDTELGGCNLVIPEEVLKRPEPQPENGPLIIEAGFAINRIRDVPDSGGSFGVDLLQV